MHWLKHIQNLNRQNLKRQKKWNPQITIIPLRTCFNQLFYLFIFLSLHWKTSFHRTTHTVDLIYFEYGNKKASKTNRMSIYLLPQITVRTQAHTTKSQNSKRSQFLKGLTRVGVRVAICFGPLVRRGLVIEFVLWLNQRKRVWDQGATTHRLVVS